MIEPLLVITSGVWSRVRCARGALKGGVSKSMVSLIQAAGGFVRRPWYSMFAHVEQLRHASSLMAPSVRRGLHERQRGDGGLRYAASSLCTPACI